MEANGVTDQQGLGEAPSTAHLRQPTVSAAGGQTHGR
jgi:hypothetical protein